MTNDEILQAAKEVGISRIETGLNLSAVERFAAIIEKRTIERCAARAFDFWVNQIDTNTESAAAAIRKLGEQIE